jgi:hypothetical protein
MPTYQTKDPAVLAQYDAWRLEVDRRLGELSELLARILDTPIELVGYGDVGTIGVVWDGETSVPAGWRKSEIVGAISPDLQSPEGRGISAHFFGAHAGVADVPHLDGMENFVRSGGHWLRPVIERVPTALVVAWPVGSPDPRSGAAAVLWEEILAPPGAAGDRVVSPGCSHEPTGKYLRHVFEKRSTTRP